MTLVAGPIDGIDYLYPSGSPPFGCHIVHFVATDQLAPVVKKIGVIFLLIVLVLTLILYGQEMLGAVGSFAPPEGQTRQQMATGRFGSSLSCLI